MGVCPREVEAVIAAVASSHRPDVMLVVTMHHFASSLLDQYGRANGVSLEAQITTLDEVVRFWTDGHGVSVAEKAAARNSLLLASRLIERSRTD